MKRFLSTILILLCFASSASALEIRVRGEARLQVSANAAGTVAQVYGILSDELQRSLAHRAVSVRIEDKQGTAILNRTATTDASGRFSVQEELPPGTYSVVARFAENDHFDGVIYRGDITLEPAEMAADLYAPNLAVGREVPVFVYGQAAAAGIPFQGSGEVYVNDDKVGELEFDQSGRGSLDIVSRLQEGENQLRLMIPGSAYREATETFSRIRYTEHLKISASMEERVERLSRGLSIFGTVTDAKGNPVPQMRVQGVYRLIEAAEDSEAKETILTISDRSDENGRFSTFVAWTRLGDGVWTGRARAIPNVGTAVEANVNEVDVDTATSRAALNVLGMLVLLLGLLVLLGSVLRQAKLYIDKFREGRELKKRSREALETEDKIIPIFLDTSVQATPAARSEVGGLVWDVWQKKQVRTATVELKSRGGEILSAQADERGRFEFGEVPAGEYAVTVTAPGFVAGTMRMKVPHDGRFRSFRVDLIAVPLKIRRLYQLLMAEASGDDPWGLLSPAEIETEMWSLFHDPSLKWKSEDERKEVHDRIADALKSEDSEAIDGVSLLSVITDIVEESYFSGRVYDESVWLLARSIAIQLRQNAGLEELV